MPRDAQRTMPSGERDRTSLRDKHWEGDLKRTSGYLRRGVRFHIAGELRVANQADGLEVLVHCFPARR